MVFFRTELSEGHEDILPFAGDVDLVHNFSCVAWRVNFSYVSSAPHLSYVTVSPSWIGCVLVTESAALRVPQNQNSVVYSLQRTKQTCLLIIELRNCCLFQHVLRNGWIVSIRHDFNTKKTFNQRVCKANTDCIDKNITRVLRYGLETSHLKSNYLH